MQKNPCKVSICPEQLVSPIFFYFPPLKWKMDAKWDLVITFDLLTYNTNTSELRFARPFQGHPTWPYLARSNMRKNAYLAILGHISTYLAYLAYLAIFGPTYWIVNIQDRDRYYLGICQDLNTFLVNNPDETVATTIPSLSQFQFVFSCPLFTPWSSP